MKIRNGLVSNSSSSSFVIIGFKFKNEEYNKRDILTRLCIEIPEDDDELNELFYETMNERTHVIDTDDGLYVGKIVCDFSNEDYMPEQQLNIPDCIKEVEDIRKDFKIDEKIPILMYTGVRSC